MSLLEFGSHAQDSPDKVSDAEINEFGLKERAIGRTVLPNMKNSKLKDAYLARECFLFALRHVTPRPGTDLISEARDWVWALDKVLEDNGHERVRPAL